MRWNPLAISLDTILAASPLLGHALENRSSISAAQSDELAGRFASLSATPLRSDSQAELFTVAPLDILASSQSGVKQFHLLELNGTGIGGLTNMTDRAVAETMTSLAESCTNLHEPGGVLLLAVSGKESESCPRLNRLMHEKLLFVEAMREGMVRTHGRCGATNVPQMAAERASCDDTVPTVAIGYMKDFLNDLTIDKVGCLWLHGRRVVGAVNDRFCQNVLQKFDYQVDLHRFKTFNRCFTAGGDKGVAYGLMNDFVRANPSRSLPERIHHEHAHTRLDLIEMVLDWLAKDRQVVIKPHGTGLGHGIEFFFDRHEPLHAIVEKIDRSLAQTEEYYGMAGGALPYTVCEYVDACRVEDASHPLHGHKYELRVVVYRHKQELRAFPSIAKVARQCDDGTGRERRALINNITASGDTDKVNGSDFMLPLCATDTWRKLGLGFDEVASLCSAATGYVRYVLDQVEDNPARFGLPSAGRSMGHSVTEAVPAMQLVG